MIFIYITHSSINLKISSICGVNMIWSEFSTTSLKRTVVAATCGRYCCSSGWRSSPPREMQYVCLSQSVNVCTLLNNVSVCMCMSVTLLVHMYECEWMRAAVSGGAKWASTESRKDLCSWHISATLHDGGERESMYPCSVNYDPSLSASLSHSISLLRLPPGQQWFNDERDHFDYSSTADKSAGRAVVSHRHAHSNIYRRARIKTDTHTLALSVIHK